MEDEGLEEVKEPPGRDVVLTVLEGVVDVE